MNRSKIEEAKKVIAMIADDFNELKDSLLGIGVPKTMLENYSYNGIDFLIHSDGINNYLLMFPIELEEQYFNWLDGKTPALDECWAIKVDDIKSYRYALEELCAFFILSSSW